LKLSHQHILVIQTAFIGDAILASSVIEKLHQFYPSSSISILVRKGNESLYQNHPFLKEVIIWDKQEGKYSSLWKTLKKIRSEKYDTIINLHRASSLLFPAHHIHPDLIKILFHFILILKRHIKLEMADMKLNATMI
jgi:ADP-heptose:LPS heptosyltransferase